VEKEFVRPAQVRAEWLLYRIITNTAFREFDHGISS
jgi:hypothetical protein